MAKETLVEGVFCISRFSYFEMHFYNRLPLQLHGEGEGLLELWKGFQIHNKGQQQFSLHGNLKSETLYQYGCLKIEN
jgi:hypothetical protein